MVKQIYLSNLNHFFPKPLAFPSFVVDIDKATKGSKLFYGNSCSSCHGGGGISGGMAPDLRASPICTDLTTFKQVVKDGIKIDRGMPNFKNFTDDDLLNLLHFIRYLANYSIEQENVTTE